MPEPVLVTQATSTISAIATWSYWKLVWAFLAGAGGSSAYITALYFHFVGHTQIERRIVIERFLKKYSIHDEVDLPKCIWYCTIGGAIAVIFQVDVPNFVAVQSLILGATWPAVISQFLSGRMVSPSKQDLNDIQKKEESIAPNLIEMANDIKKKAKGKRGLQRNTRRGHPKIDNV